jgi:signal transduction histidine kinase
MKKSICIFLIAVLLPSCVLGWLALRSAEEQKIILERRTAELYQKETEAVAGATRTLIDEQRRDFANAVRKMVADAPADKVATDFTRGLAAVWSRKAMGFAIDKQGRLISPSAQHAAMDATCQKFLWENGAFLGGAVAATVYPVSVEDLNRPELMRKKGAPPTETQDPAAFALQKKFNVPAAAQQALTQNRSTNASAAVPESAQQQLAYPQTATDNEAKSRQEPALRNVSPQQQFDSGAKGMSQLWSETAEFRALTASAAEGMVTRFVQDRLDMIFWLRPAQAPELTFGCLIESHNLRDLWNAAMPDENTIGAREFFLALLDDKARPVISSAGSTHVALDWKRPFVASEIGEALPHWEAALYLKHPEQLGESARGLRRIFTFLIVTSLGAIAWGGWLVVADARRQLLLAQKKTDFVSNVSHELKTPLTSIRMFAELMQTGRAEPAKHSQYLRIIMVEAERLTRLINNVLDFARLERRQKHFEKRRLDLHEVIARTWESQALHLHEAGFTTRWNAAPGAYPVIGDEDALAQILVNLLSNAEKYAGAQKEIELQSYLDDRCVCVAVLDRGPGVPPGEDAKIFEAFYRAHDSLSSGIQGSGLGLTLAQRLAREHGGEIRHSARPGGGSNFTLRLPLAEATTASHDDGSSLSLANSNAAPSKGS